MIARVLAATLSAGSTAHAAAVRPATPEIAGGASHSAAAGPVPRLSLSLPSLSTLPGSPLTQNVRENAGTIIPADAAAPARNLPVLSRDIARDAAAALLDEAGFRDTLSEHGLILWHILRAKTRSGERAFLTVSLPSDERPFALANDSAARQSELERRIALAEKRIVSEAARILGMEEDMVGVSGRLIESCCGAGCQSCLLTKDRHAERWTGQKPRKTEDTR